jgi:hypothetical protein
MNEVSKGSITEAKHGGSLLREIETSFSAEKNPFPLNWLLTGE